MNVSHISAVHFYLALPTKRFRMFNIILFMNGRISMPCSLIHIYQTFGIIYGDILSVKIITVV